MIIRQATQGDAPAVAAIYGHHVLNGLGTFEEVPPTDAEIADRIEAVLARSLPYLVAEDDGAVIGFAYAAPFRPRAAYRYTVEDSVYIAPDAIGRGVGKALVSRVIAECEALGLRQMIAVIGDSDNAGSVGLHRSLGFEPAGVGRALGYKFGRWVDVVWMQRALNGGEETTPTGDGLTLSGG
ncbi:MAG TPA: GNAT family N-acetyltransferase [Caulobacteraceae bacterium]|nr:GNAT family N-acetyltransferase [Caulobacteraceae bacterium]